MIVQFALIWWLTQSTGPATVLATASLVGVLPQVVIGPFAGALVDRWPRRLVMIAADSLIALTTLGLIALYLAGQMQAWHIYVVMFLHQFRGILHGAVHVRGEDRDFRVGNRLEIEQPRVQALQLVQVALHVTPRASTSCFLAAKGDEADFRVIWDVGGVLRQEPAQRYRQCAGREIIRRARHGSAVLPAPRCDASSLAMMAARSRSCAVPGEPGPTSAQILFTMSKAY
jgi:hypothetical protein